MEPARRRAGCAALLIATLLVGGCGDGERRVGSALSGGSAEVALSAPVREFDPARLRSRTLLELAAAAYAPLYRRVDGDGGVQLEPVLARSLPKTSDDRRTLVIELRPGLRFADGRPLRARDAAATIERLVRFGGERARAFSAIDGWGAFARGKVRRLRGVSARGLRLQLRLRHPDVTLPWVLAEPWSGIVPAATDARGSRTQPPSASGLYAAFLRRQRGGSLVLVRRRRLQLKPLGPGYLDRIEASAVSGDALNLALRDRVDVVERRADRERIPILRSTYADRYRDVPTRAVAYLFLNPRLWPFGDRRVRRAVALALDYAKIRRLALGFLDGSCDPLPEGVLGHRGDGFCARGARGGAPRPDDAQRILADAGVLGAPVTVWAERSAVTFAVAREYARTLNELGFRVRLRLLGAASFRRALPRLWTRAQTGLAVVDPQLVHPYAYLAQLRLLDPVARRELAVLRRQADDAEPWQGLFDRVLGEGWVVPLGTLRSPLLLSRRIDVDACLRVDPLDGLDYARLCLR
ncbi:ABC transporter substrate-binding protein [Thermoleophilum album]|uniref:Peptide/nickel transport system substrate-binding protein n=1 Tax=Thermoleophilum album TaxID=29539 RepID=A0A1H6FTG0_THEAL|nr:ABC transporter substrate-binding protein [Thermoleophilum album]SEH14106.1 peptide/nickel transport system substrate-binding protein [Thermoleophilum album]